MINIKGFLRIYLKKDNIDYEILSSKVDDINFYDIYNNTLYNYLNYFSELSTGKI